MDRPTLGLHLFSTLVTTTLNHFATPWPATFPMGENRSRYLGPILKAKWVSSPKACDCSIRVRSAEPSLRPGGIAPAHPTYPVVPLEHAAPQIPWVAPESVVVDAFRGMPVEPTLAGRPPAAAFTNPVAILIQQRPPVGGWGSTCPVGAHKSIPFPTVSAPRARLTTNQVYFDGH